MASYDKEKAKEYWDCESTESMYDKNWLAAEIELIRSRLTPSSRILDAGCGEGEGVLVYAEIPDVTIDAADFSETRLRMAAERLKDKRNVSFKKIDFTETVALEPNFDYVISQRFLINILDWDEQKVVLLRLMNLLVPNGHLLLMEGSKKAVDELNEFRAFFGLPPINVKWHNLFLDDELLNCFMDANGFTLAEHTGLGTYYFLTRGVQPIFNPSPNWDSRFNEISSQSDLQNAVGLTTRFSRIKLWVFKKRSP